MLKMSFIVGQKVKCKEMGQKTNENIAKEGNRIQ